MNSIATDLDTSLTRPNRIVRLLCSVHSSELFFVVIGFTRVVSNYRMTLCCTSLRSGTGYCTRGHLKHLDGFSAFVLTRTNKDRVMYMIEKFQMPKKRISYLRPPLNHEHFLGLGKQKSAL